MTGKRRCRLIAPFLLLGSLCAHASAQQPVEPIASGWCRNLPRAGYKDLERVNVGSDWFEVYRVRPGVFAIYEPHQFEEVISYLVLGSKRALLFDTGLGVGRISDVTSRLTLLPVTVLNSHTHFDHVGGNAEFANIYGRDTAFTRDNAAGKTSAYARDTLAPDRLCGPLPPGVAPASYSTRPWKITHYVRDGEVVSLGGRDLEVLLTPGHTPDSISLLDRQNRLLFTGDSYYPGPIYLFVPETDLTAYARSMARLADLAPGLDVVLSSHNQPLARPEVLVKVSEAVKRVRSGTMKPEITPEGLRSYAFDGFSLLLPK